MWLKAWTIGLMLVVLALMCVGLVTVYSTTCDTVGTAMFMRQAMWIGMGLLCCIAIAVIPLEWLARYSNILLLIIGLLLLYLFCGVLVDKFISKEAVAKMPLLEGATKGSFRWLKYHGYGLQPSEYAKFALLLFLSAYYGTRSKNAIDNFWKGLVIPSLSSGTILLLILLGKDLSTTLITGFMVGGIMFCAGVKIRHLALLFFLGAVAAVLMLVTSPERMSRIKSFTQVDENASDDSYQLQVSQYALGGGGLKGRGFTRSIMKKGYLPEKHTDFILAIWGEEMGFLGTLFVLLCYMGLMVCLIGLACISQDRVGMLICMGFCVLVTMQSIVNIGVISGWGPTTGVTAPYISYGGSSILSLLMCTGLVFNVCGRTSRALREKHVKGSNLPTFEEIRSVMNEGLDTEK